MPKVTAGTAGHHHRIVAATGRSALFFAAFLLAFAAAMLAWGSPASAAPASDMVVPLKQPDGGGFDARQYGDEWNHGYETRDGYTVVRNPETEAWEYAVDPAGSESLEPSGRVVGEEAPPEGVDKNLRPDDVTVPEVEYPEPEREVQPSSVQVASEDGEMTATAATGEHKSLVILVQFTDQASMGTTPAQWNSKFFGATDSVRDYFQEASYGKLNIGAASESHGTANDGVVGWLTLPYAHPNTANFPNGAADRKTVADAVKAADAYVNYKAYDANNDNKLSSKELHVTVIAAGQEGSCCRSSGKAVWGHFWTLFSGEQPTVDGVLFGSAAANGGYTQFGEYHRDHMATLGIMVHEMGHDLGLPDLYDTDLSSEGVGDWSVMGGGSWNTVSGQYLGSVPPFPDAWSRYYEGDAQAGVGREVGGAGDRERRGVPVARQPRRARLGEQREERHGRVLPHREPAEDRLRRGAARLRAARVAHRRVAYLHQQSQRRRRAQARGPRRGGQPEPPGRQGQPGGRRRPLPRHGEQRVLPRPFQPVRPAPRRTPHGHGDGDQRRLLVEHERHLLRRRR